MKSTKVVVPVIWGWLLIGLVCFLPLTAAWAQDSIPQPSTAIREDFSDDELKSFVQANEKVMSIQMAAEQNMIKAIENEGLTVDRFHQILEQQRDPQRGTETSEQELKSFNNAAQVILEENAKVEAEMTTTIEEQGIDIETYKQIMLAYQQSPAIQSRVNGLVKDEGGQDEGQR